MKDWNDRSKSAQVGCLESVMLGVPSGDWVSVRKSVHDFARTEYSRKKRHEREMRQSYERYEESKTKRVHFYICPSCGLDTGEYEDGEFVADNPPEFIWGVREYMGQSAEMVRCPECDYEMGEELFVDEWRDVHGRISETDSVPYPEPTASRLHRQSIEAAQLKRFNRRF